MKQIHFKQNQLQKVVGIFLIATSFAISSIAQVPAYGTTGFNNIAYDQVPFALGSAYPNAVKAANVAGTGWDVYIGAIGVYQITQVNKGANGTYDGAITATNFTPPGTPTLYQTFTFTSTNASKFKLNSVKVKIDNASAVPVPMILAGAVTGSSTGSTQSFVAMPGSNWQTLTTSFDPNFSNINSLLIINVNGSTAVAEMSIDDINISAPVVQAPAPVFTTQPTNKTVCAGTSATFSGTATNAATYYWLVSTDGLIYNKITAANAGTTFSNYTTSSIVVNNPSIALNGLYLGLVALNSTGVNAAANVARLYVNAAPTIFPITGLNTVCKGYSIALNNAVGGGTWSSQNAYASVDQSGVVMGLNAGAAVIKYTIISGGCSSSSSYNVAVGSNLVVPSIAYAVGTVNPQYGAGGTFCSNKTFTLVGTPVGGKWRSTGVISVDSISGFVSTGNIAGAASVTYTTSVNGCLNSKTINAVISVCSHRGVNGLAENEQMRNDNLFAMYPNPAKSFINLNVKTLIGTGNIVITDLYGKHIKNQTVSLGINNIDVSALDKGFYTVSIITNDGKKTKKLIIE